MSTTGRRSGTRRRRAAEAGETGAAAALAPIETTIDRGPAASSMDASVELLDDHETAIAGGSRSGARVGRSLTGAIAGTMLVVGLAFGAAMGPGGSLGPAGEHGDPQGGVTTATNDGGAGHDGGDEAKDGSATGYEVGGDGAKDDRHWGGEPGDGTDGTPKPEQPDGTPKPEQPDATEKPDVDEPDPTRQPEPDPTKKPEPERTPKPTEKPDPTDPGDEVNPISLALAIKELHPVMEWGSCDGLDFDYYKVVRSSDSTVTWPAGDGDEVFAAIERGGTRKAYDKNAPHGVKVWYRVFCVNKTDAGYRVVNASPAKGIEVPEEPTPPDPVSLAFSAEINGEGKVVLDWSACEVEGFAFYKVVRSTSNDNPSYLPWTDGSEVIAVVESRYATEWLDHAPDGDGTAWYRVQCIGYSEAGKVLLGQTAVVAVTAE